MPAPHLDPDSLRNVAEQVVSGLDDEGILWAGEREDYVRSLVRQWLAYEAHATLFTREGQLYFTIAPALPGKFEVGRGLAEIHWADSLVDDWKVRREDLLDAFRQLNVAQSAKVVNAEGLCLRLSVNPRTSINQVDPVNSPPLPPADKPDYHAIALRAVRGQAGQWLDKADEEVLAACVAKQWLDHEGHAVLFLPGQRLVFTIVDRGDGHKEVGVNEGKLDLIGWLHDLGFEPAAVPDVIRRLNTGEQIPFRDRGGVACVLWPDPREGTAFARPANVPGPEAGVGSRPLFCPGCSAVLDSWREGEDRKTCPHCGLAVEFPV